ncbi:hypothetical protein [Methylobacterium aquaticum]|uniref:hypothetical protein n=1 Tax=Methylobacterium aquaticum TaxID=270351 RepID=UPI00069E3E8D|nr:hypothetical protein [Methylobacterium aquaticum]
MVLLQALKPCDDPLKVEAVVSKLLLGMEGKGASVVGTAALNREYVDALEGLPLWAIIEAADRFRRAETILPRQSRWRPNPPEFVEETRAGLAEIRETQIRLRDVLEAEVVPDPDPEREAAVRKVAAEAIARRAAEVKATLQGEHQASQTEVAATLGGPPLAPNSLSPTALAKYRRPAA